MEENYLQHYGVLGMKWGRRRSEAQLARDRGKSRRTKSEDHLRAKSLKKKRLSQLSNSELKELNNRMQLEQQYKSLKKQNVSAGKKFVKDVAYESGKQIAAEYTKKYAKKGIAFLGDAMKEPVR